MQQYMISPYHTQNIVPQILPPNFRFIPPPQINYNNESPVNYVHMDKPPPQHLVTSDQHLHNANAFSTQPHMQPQQQAQQVDYNQPENQQYQQHNNNNNRSNNDRGYSNNNNKRYQNNSNSRQPYNSGFQNNNYKGNNKSPHCYYCKASGHVITSCDKLKRNFQFCGFCGQNPHSQQDCDSYKEHLNNMSRPGPSLLNN
jgi:hypothetical protein